MKLEHFLGEGNGAPFQTLAWKIPRTEEPGGLPSVGHTESDTTERLTLTFTFQDVQFGSVAQLCPTLCHPMDFGTPGFLVRHQFADPTQTHVH